MADYKCDAIVGSNTCNLYNTDPSGLCSAMFAKPVSAIVVPSTETVARFAKPVSAIQTTLLSSAKNVKEEEKGWDTSRHIVPTCEGPYLLDCSELSCKDPTHFGGSIHDSAKYQDDIRSRRQS